MSWHLMAWSAWDFFIWIKIKLKSWIVILSMNLKILSRCHWQTTKLNFYLAINSLHFHQFNIFRFKIICCKHLRRDGSKPQDCLKLINAQFMPYLCIKVYELYTMEYIISVSNRSAVNNWHRRESLELRLFNYSILQLSK